jgi:hypothetical protein
LEKAVLSHEQQSEVVGSPMIGTVIRHRALGCTGKAYGIKPTGAFCRVTPMRDAWIPGEFERQRDRDVDREWGDAPSEQPDPEFTDDDPRRD